MNDTSQPKDRFDQLLDRLIEGQLTDAEFAEFAQCLRDDLAARDRYAASMVLHSLLSLEHSPLIVPADGGDRVAPPMPHGRPARRRPAAGFAGRAFRKFNRPVFWSVTAAAVLFAAYVTVISWNMLGYEAEGERLRVVADNRPSVGAITASENALWRHHPQAGSPAASAANQPEIAQGEPLQLASGLVELKLKQGVTLFVQGPANWTIDGENAVSLDQGTLVAKVPKQAHGFSVETPTTSIVDRGTEFSVTVDRQGQTETQVFRGVVDVKANRAATAHAQTPQRRRLVAGEAIRIDATGSIASIPPVAETAEQFLEQDRARRRPFSPDELSPYAKYVIEQTKPVAYWDFSWYRNSMKIVNDRLAGYPLEHFAPRQVGLLGPAASQGFAALGTVNPAIDFNRNSSNDHMAIDSLTGALKVGSNRYSLQFWFRATAPFLADAGQYLFGRGDRGADALGDSLMILEKPAAHDSGVLGCLVFFDGKHRVRSDFAMGQTPIHLNRWYVVTFVRDEARASVYINGQLDFTTDAPWKGQVGDRLAFGNRADFRSNSGLTGDIDEVAVWDRALTAEVVQSLYEMAITPNNRPSE
jgi:hypothetical protein